MANPYERPHSSLTANHTAVLAHRRRRTSMSHSPAQYEHAMQTPLPLLGTLPREVLYNRPQERPLSPGEAEALKTTPQPLTPEQYTALCKKTFTEAFRQHLLPNNFDATTTERVRCAWRLTREMARSRRLLSHDEPMIEGLTTQTKAALCKWNMPEYTEQANFSNDERFGNTNVNQLLVQLYRDALKLKPQYWIWCFTSHAPLRNIEVDHLAEIGQEYFEDTPTPEPIQELPQTTARPGLALMPPPVPLMHYDDDWQISPEYTPHDDPALNLYIAAVGYTADYLGVWSGSIEDKELGSRGMIGMTNPHTIRLAFPTRLQIMSWEYILITETLDTLIKRGTHNAYENIVAKYGLTHVEAHGLIKMAQRFAKNLMTSEREEQRAIMLLRCEEQINRSKDACDLNSEMKITKMMAMLMGLTRTEAEDDISEFAEIVKAATNERRALVDMSKPIFTGAVKQIEAKVFDTE